MEEVLGTINFSDNEEIGTIDIPEDEELGTINIPKEPKKESTFEKAFGYGVEAPLGAVQNLAGGVLGVPAGIAASLEGKSDKEIEEAVAKSAQKYILPPSTQAGQKGAEILSKPLEWIGKPISDVATLGTTEPMIPALVSKYLAGKATDVASLLPGRAGENAEALGKALAGAKAPSIQSLLTPVLGEQGAKFIPKTAMEFAAYPALIKGAGKAIGAGKSRLQQFRTRGAEEFVPTTAKPTEVFTPKEIPTEQMTLDLGGAEKVPVPKIEPVKGEVEIPATIAEDGQVALDFTQKPLKETTIISEEAPKTYKVTVKDNEGNIVVGNAGETHAQQIQRLMEEGKDVSWGAETGFMDEAGNYIKQGESPKIAEVLKPIEQQIAPSGKNFTIAEDFEQRKFADLSTTEERTLNPEADALTKAGWSFDEIDNMTVAEVRKNAARLKMTDEEVIASTPPEVLAKANEVKKGIEAKVLARTAPEVVAETPMRSVTTADVPKLEELKARFENLARKETNEANAAEAAAIADEIMKLDDGDIIGPAEQFAEAYKPVPLSPEASAARLAKLKERVEAAKQKSALAKIDKTRREKAKVDEAVPFEETPEGLVDEHLDTLSKEYWENVLAKEGMPSELNFDMLGLQTVYEMSMDFLRKSPTVQNLARIGKGVMLEGKRTFGEFRARLREIVGDMWDTVSHLARQAWDLLKSEEGKIAWHGTKAKFEKFEDKYIGSGEGAQAFGWGHYFSSSREVAKWYAENVGKVDGSYTQVSINGKPLSLHPHILGKIGRNTGAGMPLKEAIRNAIYDHIDQIKTIKRISLGDEVLHEGAIYDPMILPDLKKLERDLREYKNTGNISVDTLKKYQETFRSRIQYEKAFIEKSLSKIERLKGHPKPDVVRTRYTGYNQSPQQEIVARQNYINRKAKAISVLERIVAEPIGSLLSNLKIETKGGERLLKTIETIQKPETTVASIEVSQFGKVIHEVELPDNVWFLDLDKPVHQQFRDQVRSALVEEYGKVEQRDAGLNQLQADRLLSIMDKLEGDKVYTGNSLQTDLRQVFGARNTSTFLRDKADIKGNTYSGGTSGQRNYVIFDESLPKIKNTVTLDMLGLQGMYERLVDVLSRKRIEAKMPGVSVLKEITGEEPAGIFKIEKPKDIKAISRLLSPTKSLANTLGDKHVYNINKAEMYYGHMHSQNSAGFRTLYRKLTQAERENIRPILEGKSEGISPAAIQAAEGTRAWLDGMRERYKEFQREQYKRHLKPEEFAAINDLINHEDFVSTFAKHQKTVDPDLLLDLWSEYKNIDKWGLDDYVPNVELGTVHILDGSKNLKAVAVSEFDAARKAADLLEKDPELKTLYIDTNPKMFSDMKIGITSTQYWSMARKLQKALNAQVESLNKKTAANMARKALNREFSIMPTDKYSPFTETRRDILLGEKDITGVMYKYSLAMEKKMAFDPVIAEIRKDLPNLPKNIRKEVLSLIEDTKGRYGVTDEAIDDLVAFAVGDKVAPFALTRALGRLRTYETNAKLGYRPVAAAVNRVSGQLHIFTKVGNSYLSKGRDFLKTPEGKAFVEEVYPYLGIDFAHEAPGALGMKTEIWKPLGLFERAELPNRLEGVASNYLFAKDVLKLSEDAAVEHAIRANWFQNFTYNMASLPGWMRGPVMRTVAQFKPYLLKEVEFISSLRGQEIARYIAAQTLLTGPRGYLTVIRSLPWLLGLGAWKMWDDIEAYMNAEFPRIWRGVGGFVGVDVTMPATFQFPTGAGDWLGAIPSDLGRIGKVMIDFASGVDVTGKDAIKTMGGIIPAVKNMTEVINTVIDKDGTVRNDRGEVIFNIYDASDTDYEKASKFALYAGKRTFGAEPLDVSVVKVADQIEKRRDEVETINKRKIVDKLIDDIRAGKDLDEDVLNAFMEYGLTIDTLTQSYKWKELTPRMRAILRSSIKDRLHTLESYPEPTTLEAPAETYDSVMRELRSQ